MEGPNTTHRLINLLLLYSPDIEIGFIILLTYLDSFTPRNLILIAMPIDISCLIKSRVAVALYNKVRV